MKHAQIRMYRQILKLIILALLGLSTILTIPTLSAQPTETITQPPNAQELLQQGIKLYEGENFSAAVEIWQKAADTFAIQGDTLNQALVLSNLSLSYQHLGQWQEAETAIERSINLLKNSNTINNTQIYSEIIAKAFNTQGRLQWVKGELEESIKTWEKAVLYYAKADNNTGVIHSLINQSKSMEALGKSTQAQKILENVDQLVEKQSDSELKARGWLSMGSTYREIGELDKSKEVLQKSLAEAEKSKINTIKYAVLLELGNTEVALGNRAIAIRKDTEEEEHIKAAIKYYQNAIASNSSTLRLQAQLNQLSLFIEIGKLSETEKLWQEIQNTIATLPPSRTAIYAQLNFARSLTCLKNGIDTEGLSCTSCIRQEKRTESLPKLSMTSDSLTWDAIAKIIATALQQAQALKDRRAESYALGQLGGLYEITGQFSEAQKLTQKAIILAEKSQDPNIIYRWDWQLGRLLEKQQNIEGAIAAYREAVATLKSVRKDLLTINSDVQFSFRDEVEPVHRKLVDLLLRNQGDDQKNQKNLKEAIKVIDDLQLAEIENFLSCNLSDIVQLDQDIDKVDRKAAFIYGIILDKRIEVIFKLPDDELPKHAATWINRTEVEQTLRKLRQALGGLNGGEVTEKAGIVYEWLIAPLEKYLKNSPQVENLVFVLDGELRNIPMSVLYDKKSDKYLIEKNYNLVLLPSSQLFDLQSSPEELDVLGAGISEQLTVKDETEDRNFAPLQVTEELQGIKDTVSSEILLNTQFTQPNFQEKMNSGDFSVLHMATHGNFSSDPEQTYLLVHSGESSKGKLLKAKEINDLLRSENKQVATPLELLVLSACETAEGDNRATLGLAGLAVRAGARSTLATLWQVSDNSTIKLMKHFYSELNKGGVTKAEALHHAQQSLLSDEIYQNPYYWASYILVGNWR